MAKILFHIGMPKTATTTLQENIFNELYKQKKINFIGRYMARGDKDFFFKPYEIVRSIRYDSEIEFNKKLPLFQKEFDSYLKENKLNIFSEELFTISYRDDVWDFDVIKNLQRVNQIFSDHKVEVLLSIRDQKDIIYSFFVEFFVHQLFKDKNNDSIEKYIYNGIKDKKTGNLSMFFYDETIKFCEKEFHSVHLLVYEDLKYNKVRYVDLLSQAILIDKVEVAKLLNKKEKNVKKRSKEGYYTDFVTLDEYLGSICVKLFPKYYKKFFYTKIKPKVFPLFFKQINLFNKKVEYLNEKQLELIENEFYECNKYIDHKYNLELYRYNYYQNKAIE